MTPFHPDLDSAIEQAIEKEREIQTFSDENSDKVLHVAQEFKCYLCEQKHSIRNCPELAELKKLKQDLLTKNASSNNPKDTGRNEIKQEPYPNNKRDSRTYNIPRENNSERGPASIPQNNPISKQSQYNQIPENQNFDQHNNRNYNQNNQ